VVYAKRVTDKRIRSLQPILEEVREERSAQLRHYDALDVKAGIVLGFSGALVALAPVANLVVDIGRGVAVLSGLVAIAAFWPRRYLATDLRALRNLYLGSEPEFTRLRVLDTQIDMTERVAASMHGKAWLLRWAMSGLGVAALLTASGLGLD
jgi:hypothetical protein